MVSVGLLRIASKLIHDISYPHDELKELSIELGLLAKTSKNQSYYAIVSSKDDVPDGLLCFNIPSTNILVIGSIQSLETASVGYFCVGLFHSSFSFWKF